MSQSVLQIPLVNIGASTCLLRGQPRVSGMAPSGVRLLLPARPGPTFAGGLIPADIAPGSHGYLNVGTGNACGTGPDQTQWSTYQNLTFLMPDDGVLTSNLSFEEGSCGITVDQLGLLESDLAGAPPGPFAALTAQLDGPKQVHVAGVLYYTVTLTNPTSEPIVLAPCPSYTEWASDSGTPYAKNFPTFAYQLNCSVERTIPAGASVRFAMELRIPQETLSGFGKFGWFLNEPGGPYAGGPLRIEP